MISTNDRTVPPERNAVFSHTGALRRSLLAATFLLATAVLAAAQNPPQSTQTQPSMEVYGFVMLDIGHNFTSIAPNWFDTMRVTKLPTFDNQYGKDGSAFAGVRQTRFGTRATAPTPLGDLKTTFEFELFGVGVDEGQTTFRLRHAYGELGHFGAGQTWSPFMDPNVFPNSLEYWGPTGMVFFRNVQVRWMPLQGDTNATIALERPGASADTGTLATRNELANVKGRNPMLDLTGQFTYGKPWGYARIAGALRRLAWDDLNDDAVDLSDNATGWGINLSSNINLGPNKRDVIRLQYIIGDGVENYMNDTPVDVAVEDDPGDPNKPIKGDTLPIMGVVAFLDHTINSKWSTTIGYSRQDVDNTDFQKPDAFHIGQYALGNVIYYPVPNMLVGGELQWGRRESLSGYTSDGFKIQFSFKYSFSQKFGG